MPRREHPARAAAHRASRKIFATIRATFDVDYAHGWCGPDWEKAVALEAELSSAPAHRALLDAAARAPGFADGGE
jgi:hypothetical protein